MKFLNQYIKDIDLALAYIEAETIPCWEQHLKTFREILCYAFAYDRQNYARWGPVYLAEMFQLAETAPPVYTAFQDGKHVVTRSSSTYFNSVWSDLGLEQSVVKDTKSKSGGIIGFSRQEQAAMKWALTVHEGSAILRNFKAFCGLSDRDEIIHRELTPTAITKGEAAIRGGS